jgi:transcriptional regulator with XRE-family HTH domain
MSDVTSHFGAALRQMRDRRGWSQEALAERADLNRSYVGDLERSLAVPSLQTLEKLASALGCTTSGLLEHVEHLADQHKVRGLQLTAIAC